MKGGRGDKRMKIIHYAMGALTWAGLVLAGLALVVFGPSQGAAWAERAAQAAGGWERWVWVSIGAGAMLWVGLWGLAWGLGRKRKEYVTFENENGRVTVDTEAVRTYIRGLKDEFAAVVWMKSQVKVRRGALAVGLVAGVKEGTQIPETCRMLQARTKEVLAEHLGTCDLAGVAVEIDEIRRGGAASAGRE